MNFNMTDTGQSVGSWAEIWRVVGSRPCLDRPWKVVLFVGEIPGPSQDSGDISSQDKEKISLPDVVERDPCQYIGLHIKYLCYDLHLLNQIAVLITIGPSDDSVEAAARLVADNGISLFAVGKCRPEYCQFLRHPSCSRPSHFCLLIWDLLAYP